MKTIDFTRWPCLKIEGLQVFNTTADQRYMLGEDVFLHTHFPMQMRRYQNGQSHSLLSEADLLEELITENNISIGNRVFFLYGAAGSGKSELLRWIQASVSLHSPHRTKHLVRINRNELDVLSIVEKFKILLTNSFFSQNTHNRWEEARRKPRTIAKIILLSALEKTFDSDEIINKLFYRLLEWMQPRVERALAIEKVGEECNTPIELLSREDLSELQTQSVFAINLEYEQFRFHLSKAFQDLLLEGNSLTETLSLISSQLSQSKLRPIFLVDDLVQSLSIFSTDLLDYFITLDEGNWDVIIGLTPNALNDNHRGKQLLDRISYLDTFDDRVSKLFLSDERGDESYFLNFENCSAFIAPYLNMFRSINGISCRDCLFHHQCISAFGIVGDLPLAPLSKILIGRIFKNLPDGKGKARLFLRVLREILYLAITTNQMETSLLGKVKLEMAAECSDKRLSMLAEYYLPTANDLETRKFDVDFLNAFNLDIDSPMIDIQPMVRKTALDYPFLPQISLVDNTNNIFVKDWLDGKPVNRQSLQSLRRGIARWLRDYISVSYFHRPNKPRPHRIMRWNGVYLEVRPPIILEGVDNEIGIRLSPNIGILAFHLSEYTLAFGSQRNHLAGLIASNPNTIQIIHQAKTFQNNLETTLRSQLGRHPSQFAAELAALFYMLGDAPFFTDIPLFNLLPTSTLETLSAHVSIKILEYSRLLFEDYYMLRDQLYDYAGFQKTIGDRNLDELAQNIMDIDITPVSPDFIIGDLSLGEFISRVQQRISVWQNPLLSSDQNFVHSMLIRSFAEYGTTGLPFSSIPSEIWGRIKTDNPELYNHLRIFLDSDGIAHT